ncbi:LacI family DNA-binding transcriptional regulator [Mesorhizobium sp. KR9-304]|uniref:LacI family DNA-binding transcriptional regulator n=1 Tax=Mesorhizobium sp. KR9-304 TaxID=3156614 RepID=UPI0032B3B495
MTPRAPQRRAAAVTIRDVAAAARLSVTAVSRHFNNRIVLPAETVARIEAAANDLGYRANVTARRLSLGSSESLGFVLSDIAYPFFSAIASAAEAECARLGYSLLIFNSRNIADNEIAHLRRIESAQVDGILFMTNHPGAPEIAETINRVRNVVLLDEDVHSAEAPRLYARNHKGGQLATEHLLAAGHHRIAYVGGPEGLISSSQRLAGYRQALEAAGLSVDPELIRFPGYESKDGEAAFSAFDRLDDPPTAIFAAADVVALGILRSARRAGLSVPEDLSIVGFDDIPNADVVGPPLSTVRQSAETFGVRGVQLLVGLLKGELAEDVVEYVDVELVERSSVAPPRLRRHWRTAPGKTSTAKKAAAKSNRTVQGKRK